MAPTGVPRRQVYRRFCRNPDSLKPVVESLEGNVGRFVFCSTTSVYAPSDLGPIEEGFPLYRSPDASQYARDKVDCEDFLNEAYESRKFPMTILRPPYVYGPDNYIAEREFSFFARLTQSRKVIIPGDGLNLIHAVHVDDLADAFAAVPGRSHTLGQTYTIASPDVITTRGFVRVIGEVMGADVNLVHVEPREYEALGRAFYPYEWAASQVYSIEKAKHGLEWSPRYHMRDGLEMTYRWWLKQGLDKEPWDFSDEDQALSRIKD